MAIATVPVPDPDSPSLGSQKTSGRPIALVLPPLISAGLLYIAYFPVALGWAAWFALVPLLALVRRPERSRSIYLASLLGGLAFYLPILQWLREADSRMYATWIILAVMCSCYFVFGIAFLRWLDRKTALPLTFTVPIVWVALEYFRANFFGGFASMLLGSHQHDVPGGFSWYFLGHSQQDFLEIIQVADLGGSYAVTFLVASVNGLLFEVLFARAWFRAWFVGDVPPRYSRLALLGQGICAFVGLLAVLGYGVVRLGEPTGEPGPTVALIQGNVDQRIRNENTDDARRHMVKHFDNLSLVASESRPDLIVWPETSFPDYWIELEPGRPRADSQALADELVKRYRTNILLGASSAVLGTDLNPPGFNSAILIVPRNGKGAWAGRYNKIHRVPFGEYIPLLSWLPFLKVLTPYDGLDYIVQPGTEHTRFSLPVGEKKYTFGVIICYEDSVSTMARPYAGGDGLAPVDFILNISNDGWFNGSAEHDEHLALCRFRAIECRRSIGRAVNMGISALIDSSGRVLLPREKPDSALDATVWEIAAGEKEQLPVRRWGEFKKVSGVLLASVPIDTRPSFYARFGDWLPALCWLFLGGALAIFTFRRWLRKVTP